MQKKGEKASVGLPQCAVQSDNKSGTTPARRERACMDEQSSMAVSV